MRTVRKSITLTDNQNDWIKEYDLFRITSYGIAIIRILHDCMDASRHL